MKRCAVCGARCRKTVRVTMLLRSGYLVPVSACHRCERRAVRIVTESMRERAEDEAPTTPRRRRELPVASEVAATVKVKRYSPVEEPPPIAVINTAIEKSTPPGTILATYDLPAPPKKKTPPPRESKDCAKCGGWGHVLVREGKDMQQIEKRCDACEGTGLG
jgi:hypothetical protein